MKKARLTTPPRTPPDTLSKGDALARDNHWQAALAQWTDGYAHLAPPEKSARDQRVRWLIRETGPGSEEQGREREQRRAAYRILMLGVLFGVIATTSIILGMFTVNGTLPLLALGGWIGIIGSMTSAIVYALRLSTADNLSLSQAEIAKAQALAGAIDRKSADHRDSSGDRTG